MLKKYVKNTIKKLANTNGNTDGIFSSVYCDDLYCQNFPSLHPSVNTDMKILSIYTVRIVVVNKE
jgi:hypothetical protein